jgi:hypothetical protein
MSGYLPAGGHIPIRFLTLGSQLVLGEADAVGRGSATSDMV